MHAPNRVLLVDDHPMMRFGISIAIERAGGFAICGEAGTVSEAIAQTREHLPELMVLDLSLGGRDGPEFLAELRRVHSPLRILVYTALPELTYARHVFQAGGLGYLMKDEGVNLVPVALAVVAAGNRYASDAVRTAFFEEFLSSPSASLKKCDKVAGLSPRELQVLRLVGAGRGLGEMANELNLSVKTIGAHREHLKDKLGVVSARDLALIASELLRDRVI